MKRASVVFGFGVFFQVVGCGGGGGGGGFTGVPAQLIPNLRPLAAQDFSINLEDIGGGSMQKILRLSSLIANYGAGPMEIYGEIEGANTQTDVPAFQQIRWNNGDITQIPAGDFEHHDIHGHWHWENLVSFNLHQGVNLIDPYDAANVVIATTPKVSFCLLDTAKIPGFNGVGQPNSKRYVSCGNNRQGISVGWYDIYSSQLFNQWIVIDGVADGVYWVILETDPTGLLTETDETDNLSAVKIQITGNNVTVIP